MENDSDPYEVLGVERYASKQEIRRAYESARTKHRGYDESAREVDGAFYRLNNRLSRESYEEDLAKLRAGCGGVPGFPAFVSGCRRVPMEQRRPAERIPFVLRHERRATTANARGRGRGK